MENDDKTPHSDGGPLKHVYLVDGSGFIFRAYHALPPLSRPDGTPVGAVMGFCHILVRLLMETDADGLVVVFDSARRTFRQDIYADYKAHRPPPPDDLIPQFALVRAACAAFNVSFVDKEGFEADDLIATYARLARLDGSDVTIVSSDKDLMQLVGDGVNMLDPLKNKIIGPSEVFEKFGVPPHLVRDVQALCGDASDNVPGVPGIGIKTAAALIQTFGSFDGLFDNLASIPQPKRRASLEDNIELARISRALVTLDGNVPLDMPLSAFRRKIPDGAVLFPFLRAQNFKTLEKRLEKMESLQILSAPLSDDPKPVSAAICRDGYQLIYDINALKTVIDDAQNHGILAIDTETTSLNPHVAELVGISLCVHPSKAFYIPLNHKEKRGGVDLFGAALGGEQSVLVPGQLPVMAVVEALREILKDPSVLKVGHNLKYDALVLSQYNLDITPYDDTIIMSYDLDNTLSRHSLDALALRHFGHKTMSYQDVTKIQKTSVTFDYVPISTALTYGGEDADLTLRLHGLFKHRLRTEGMTHLYETMDRPFMAVLKTMEETGIEIHRETLNTLSLHFSDALKSLESEIHQLAGKPFNIASPKQLGDVLFNDLGLDTGKKNKTGAYSTNVDVLEDLAETGHALPAKILEWRHFAKLKSTYTDSLAADINPKTGRIHTTFSQTLTATGRLSSSNPNLQNIPIRTEEGQKIRTAFVAASGFQLVSLDYSQIELRLLAHMAGIESFRNAFLRDEDIHKQTASEVFGIPLDKVTSDERRKAKAINFGIIYGISGFGLARQLKISRPDASRYIAAYLCRNPGIEAYMTAQKELARNNGFVETLMGRRCMIQGIHEKNGTLRAFAERQAINAPLQGTAADIIKKSMLDVRPLISRDRCRMLLQVHDELIFEIRNEDIPVIVPKIQAIMENVVTLSVPLKVDTGIGPHWGAAHG